jgi:hypothetical protein
LDDNIKRAIQIGESNAAIIKLAKNWCAHLEVEISGGTGLVEVQTGLPIGRRSFKCEHASAAGWAGVDLAHIVLDFYDRNCADCKKRVPVRLPNISELVAKRDSVAAAAQRQHELTVQGGQAAYEKRRSQRQALSENCDDAALAIFDAVDSFDRDPSAHNAEVLTQLARVTPERFDSRVQEALFALAGENAPSTVLGTALGVLRQVRADPDALCNTALRVLTQDALPIAGSIVAENIMAKHADALAAALSVLVALAGPRQEYSFHSLGVEKEHPEGLIAAFKIAPVSVAREIDRMLRDPSKLVRIQAVHAIRLLRQTNSRFGINLISTLVQSTELPDNHYGLGTAESHVQSLLAEMLETDFDEVDASLSDSFKLLHDHDPDGGLDQVYLRLFRSRRREEEPRPVTHVHEVLFGRLLNYLSTKCAEQGSLQLLEFLRHDAEQYLDLVERHTDALLGAMAILAAEEVSASPSFLQLQLPPDPLAALEAGSRKNAIHWLIDAVAQLVGKTAAQRPETIGRALLSMSEGVDEEYDRLRAALVKALGGMAANRGTLPLILPQLYAAMTGRSQLVRAAAAGAYGHVIGRDADDFPQLLHETFITLLSDPYLVVHSAALDVLDRTRLPKDYNGRLRVIVFELIRAHGGADGRNYVLKSALDVFLNFERRDESDILQRPAVAKFAIDMIMRCESYDAAELLRRHAELLASAPNFVKSVLQILSDDESNEYRVDELLDVLRKVPAAQIRPLADDVVGAINACSQQGHHVVDRGVEILTAAGLWDHALRLSELEEARWGDSQWDRPRKLQSRLRTLACSIEHASAQRDLPRLEQALAEFRRVEDERDEDERKHHARRDPLHGIADANQGS